MRRSGWRGESYRHSLAAKGVRTGYFAKNVLAKEKYTGAVLFFDPNKPVRIGQRMRYPEYREVSSDGDLKTIEVAEKYLPALSDSGLLTDASGKFIKVGQLVQRGDQVYEVKDVVFGDDGMPKLVLEVDREMSKAPFKVGKSDFYRHRESIVKELAEEIERNYEYGRMQREIGRIDIPKAAGDWGKFDEEVEALLYPAFMYGDQQFAIDVLSRIDDEDIRMRYLQAIGRSGLLGEQNAPYQEVTTPKLFQSVAKKSVFTGAAREQVDPQSVRSLVDERGEPLGVGKRLLFESKEMFRGPSGMETGVQGTVLNLPIKSTTEGRVTGAVTVGGKPFVTFQADSSGRQAPAGEFYMLPQVAGSGVVDVERLDGRYVAAGIVEPQALKAISTAQEEQLRKSQESKARREQRAKVLAEMNVETDEGYRKMLESVPKQYMASKQGPMEYIRQETRRTHEDPGWEKFRDGVKGELKMATSLDKEWLRYQKAAGKKRPRLSNDVVERAQERGAALVGRVTTMANVEPMLDRTKGENVREASFDVLFGRGEK